MNEDHDSPWKEALEVFFQPFLQLLFPDIEALVDWRQPPLFLDKELQKITGDAESGRRYVDKLARVLLLDGEERWLLVHTEVQGTPERDFAERMYRYYSRIRERYRLAVISLAVLTDTDRGFRPERFPCHFAGSGVTFRFRTCKLLDFQADMDKLLHSDNPFALLVAAQLSAKLIRDGRQRADNLVAFYRLAIRQRLDRDLIGRLVIFLEWMVALPAEAGDYYDERISQLQQGAIMPYVSSFERKAQQKGFEQGVVQGLERGVLQGMTQGMARGTQAILLKLLARRFGELDGSTLARVQLAETTELERWAENILDASSLDEVFDAKR
ncbi:hypothetical protein DNJ95_17865 [Stutzerimonas kirkiae]|uniref:DUF4351 domain-containing protein n=1 Tax=Stutzerimonas kirkiae TaxID=2211392 RepID=A0A4Q9QWM7_9GAMM|nr:DUF4351 domain-containing protein [Stutzerimonas kirkiae]TBU88680.1 hypothetical protein DNJ96_18095 [Stutzerimonas kirkiae]TBU98500.1 hypothetical protein DNJ95_17865 [Stutzerimonas kirkiae]